MQFCVLAPAPIDDRPNLNKDAGVEVREALPTSSSVEDSLSLSYEEVKNEIGTRKKHGIQGGTLAAL